MSKAQDEFLDQMTRKLLVDWCDWSLRENGSPVAIPAAQDPYRLYAEQKKWLSSKDGATGTSRVLATGWETAARFLKR